MCSRVFLTFLCFDLIELVWVFPHHFRNVTLDWFWTFSSLSIYGFFFFHYSRAFLQYHYYFLLLLLCCCCCYCTENPYQCHRLCYCHCCFNLLRADSPTQADISRYRCIRKLDSFVAAEEGAVRCVSAARKSKYKFLISFILPSGSGNGK